MMDIEKAGFVTDDNTGGYYVCECDNCGHVFSSENALGGNAIADTGDYDDIYCPSCHQINIGQCENPEKVWNTQQAKINGLLITLKSAEQERDQYKVDAEKYALCKSKAVNDLGHNHVYSALQELESLRAQLKAAQEQEPAVFIGQHNKAEYNQNYNGPYGGAFYAAPVPAQQSPAVAVPDVLDMTFYGNETVKSAIEQVESSSRITEKAVAVHRQLSQDAVGFDECCASGESRAYEVCSRTHKQYCKYCGKERPTVQPPRITEQDAREVCISFVGYFHSEEVAKNYFRGWYIEEGIQLLDKLNKVTHETN